MTFNLKSKYQPAGDQPAAIKSICKAIKNKECDHVLLGATGTGKTFTVAHVIEKLQRSALIIAPNKTLAAQLYTEFKSLFPDNPVGYFISFYDYYQPEAYVPSSDTYIAKDSSINEDIDKMRHQTTRDLFEKKNSIIVSSVSCIYGLGSPEDYSELVLKFEVGQEIDREQAMRKLIEIQYSRHDAYLKRGHFRVRGDTLDILPAHQSEQAIRIIFFDDEIEEITGIDSMTSKTLVQHQSISIYPNSHYVSKDKKTKEITHAIMRDLRHRLIELKEQGKDQEAQRLEQRTMQDVETMEHLATALALKITRDILEDKLVKHHLAFLITSLKTLLQL